MKTKIFITNNWLCYQKWIDMAKLIKYFKVNNCIVTKNPRNADYIILVTCGAHKKRERECFDLINKLNKYKAELIIAGCLPGFVPKKLKQAFRGRTILTKDLHEIDKIFSNFKTKFSDIPETHSPPYEYLSLLKRIPLLAFLAKNLFPLKPFCMKYILCIIKAVTQKELPIAIIRIAFGCSNYCSYCITHRATGKLKSKLLNVCLKEYQELINQGYRNFLITGEDTGAYGIDINSSLSELLEKFYEISKGINATWSLESMNPKWVIKYKNTISKYIKIGKIRKISCPIESGSDRILKLMNRNYKIKEFEDILRKFKKINPDLLLETHAIVGFPSETEKDFSDTLKVINNIGFDSTSLNTYSDNKNSPSFKLSNKIDNKTIQKRIKLAKKNLYKIRIGIPLQHFDQNLSKDKLKTKTSCKH